MTDDELLRYIRENRARYTPTAIRYELRRAGHDPRAVEEALAASDAELRAEGALDLRPHAVVIMAAAYAGVWLIFLVFATLQGAAAILGIFLLIGAILSIFIIWSGRLRFVRREQAAAAVLGALIVPLAILLGLAGLCIVTTDPFNRTYLFG